MSYSALSDIQGEFKSLTFSASTTPNQTQVTAFITEADAEIDAVLGTKYAVPITDVDDLKLIRNISIGLVAGRVKNIIAVKTGQAEANQGKVSDGDSLIKAARDKLKALRLGEMVLAGSSLLTSHDGVRSGNVNNDVSAVFQKGVDSW